MNEQAYPAKVPGFDYPAGAGSVLDFSKDTIYVLLKPGHYDGLYKGDYYTHQLHNYDDLYIAPPTQSEIDLQIPIAPAPFAAKKSTLHVEEVKNKRGEICSLCMRETPWNLEHSIVLSCGHTLHCGCVWRELGACLITPLTRCPVLGCDHAMDHDERDEVSRKYERSVWELLENARMIPHENYGG
ncbi:MAG: hypothetical protein P4M11_02065 [Candidatus Pacebacteria bacterium]|nr:hypothetical protein [Candidatus Paceibacterota bacterium]